MPSATATETPVETTNAPTAEVGSKIPKVSVPKPEPDVLRWARLSEHGFAPVHGSELAAGHDLKSAYDYTIEPNARCLCKTDIQVAVPHDTYARVAPRSGLAYKHGIDVFAGVVDADYRGNVGVILFNSGDQPFEVKKGDRIAQLILEKIVIPRAVECESLTETERGEGGFGSTGHQ